jgi:peroxiredoxin
MINVGQKAPDFKLVDKDRNEVTLDSFKGKNLILFFYPLAGTGVCTKEVCALQEDFKMYQGLGANVVGISVDTIFAIKWFSEQNKIEFPLLSDFNKKTIRDYDVVLPEFIVGYKEVAKRSTFVIDKDGIVRFVEILPTAGDFPNMDAIKEAVRKLSNQPVNN